MPSVDLGRVIGATGEQGVPGGQGVPGANGKGYNPRGEWLAGVYYNNTADTVDIVYYQGSSYYCISSGSGTATPPNDTARWGLLVKGMTRLIFECTISALDWAQTGQSPFAYRARKAFPSGYLSANGIYNLSADNRILKTYGIVIGAIEIGSTYDNIVFYAVQNYQSDLPVKVYTEKDMEVVVINGN